MARNVPSVSSFTCLFVYVFWPYAHHLHTTTTYRHEALTFPLLLWFIILAIEFMAKSRQEELFWPFRYNRTVCEWLIQCDCFLCGSQKYLVFYTQREMDRDARLVHGSSSR